MVLKGKGIAEDPQDQVLSSKEICLPQRDEGRGIRDKDKREDKEEGKETRERRQELFIQKDKALPLVRKETETVHRKMAV